MFGARLLPCGRCGAWATQGGLCAGCGTVAEGEVVSLDRSAGDGCWIHVERGSAEAILAALERLAAREVTPEAQARITAARRLVQHLAGPGLTLHLDLRRGEAGHVARTARRANHAETFYVLPWLVVRSERGEARILQSVHHKVRRSFSNRVNSQDSRFALDELWLRMGGGVLRRPLQDPAALTRVSLATTDEAPGWERPLPPTAPGRVGGGALLVGLLAALLLIGALPLGLRHLARPPASSVSSAGLEVKPLTRPGLRAALEASDVWSQRKGLAAADALRPPERMRLLRAVASDATRDLDVRLQAVDRLAREGDGSTAALIDLELTLGALASGWRAPAVRHEAGRLLAEAEEVRLATVRALATGEHVHERRVVRLAEERLQPLTEESTALRSSCVLLLAASADQGGRGALALRLLEGLLRERDPLLRAQAGLALARLAPARAVPSLRNAFRRTAAEAKDASLGAGFNDWDLALMNLAQAVALSGEEVWLRAQADRLSLRPAVEREVTRLTQGS